MRYTSSLVAAQKINEELRNPKKHDADVVINDDCICLPAGNYKSYPTLTAFHNDDAEIKIIIGALGSGKSTACTIDIIKRACEMPKCKDGVRRSRVLIVRNTYDELKSTSLQMWQEWSDKLGATSTNRQPPITWTHDFYDKNGKIHLEVIFLALNSEQQLRKLGSYNITFAYINEIRELPQIILQFISSRCGRYPAQRRLAGNAKFWSGVIADSNPPSLKHWIPELEKKQTVKYKDKDGNEKQIKIAIHHQPPALLQNSAGEYVINPDAENIDNLPGGYDYYFKMLANGDDYVKVYAQGKYGIIRSGQKVYNNYNDDLHSTDDVEVLKDVQIIYGIDYGKICPAILVCQYAANQLRVIKEFVGHHVFVDDLATEELLPWLDSNAPRIKIANSTHETLDAVGRDDIAQTDSGRDKLRALGLDVRPARTNKPERRIGSVHSLLKRLNSAGEPSVIISRSGCPVLREGFNGEYKLDEIYRGGSKEYKETPLKNHPHSDIQDALQYVALEFADVATDVISAVQYQPPRPAQTTMWM
jgi:hypothetical protein